MRQPHVVLLPACLPALLAAAINKKETFPSFGWENNNSLSFIHSLVTNVARKCGGKFIAMIKFHISAC